MPPRSRSSGAATLLAAGQLGVNTTILNLAAAALLFSIGASFTLLSGLGGRQVSAELAAGRAISRMIAAGDQITVAGQSGIVSMHPTSVELQLADGVSTAGAPLAAARDNPPSIRRTEHGLTGPTSAATADADADEHASTDGGEGDRADGAATSQGERWPGSSPRKAGRSASGATVARARPASGGSGDQTETSRSAGDRTGAEADPDGDDRAARPAPRSRSRRRRRPPG